MAKYEINYACGCVKTVNLYGHHKDRERTIEWLKTQECPECKRRRENEESAAKAKAAGRPELTGTEKQIAWANTIRENTVAEISAEKGATAEQAAERQMRSVLEIATTGIYKKSAVETVYERIEKRLRKELKDDQPKIMDAAKAIAAQLGDDRTAKVVELILAAVNTITEAKEWIDNRSDAVRMLADIVAADLVNQVK